MDVQLEKLVRLQEVDNTITQLLQAVAALPNRIRSLEEEQQQQKQTIERLEKAMLAEEVKRRRLESDLKDQQQKIAKYREQSNSVKTNEQFHALQHEMHFVEEEIRRIEDEELAGMMQSEVLDRSRSEAREKALLQGKIIEKERAVILQESAAKEQELETLRNERKALRGEVNSEILQRYDRLASSSKKTAMARASGQRCLACQMALRPQYWNQVREGALLNCESCGRLLYFDPRFDSISQAASA